MENAMRIFPCHISCYHPLTSGLYTRDRVRGVGSCTFMILDSMYFAAELSSLLFEKIIKANSARKATGDDHLDKVALL